VVSWYDPAILSREVAELSGRDFLQAIADERLPNPPIASVIGARLDLVGDGEVRFRCRPDESAYNTLGMMNGGLLCALLDLAAGAAVHSLLPAGIGLASVEIKVSFLAALRARDADIQIAGTALRVGGRVGFAEAHARDSDGELVGHATSSIAILRPGRDRAAPPRV
jgi:uncharacterized protein (TIGR00369 family)